ncbi:hypothetical protein LPJ72_003376 [Coemansia sp. Benny D160-2]|nr:hypothetical protein LPJ72_003376 [Coemansia sp. Benny D160-2]
MFTISALSPPSTPRGPIFSPRQKGCGRWAVYALSLQSPGKRVKLDQQLTFASVFGATTNSTHNSSRLQQFLPQKPLSPSSSVSLSSSTLASRRMKKAPLTPLMVSKSKVLESSGPMTAGLASPMGSTGLSPIVKGLTLGRNGFGGMVGSPLKISSIGNNMGSKISSTMNSTVSSTSTSTNNTMMNSSSTRTGIKTKINEKKPVSTSSNPFPLRKVRKPVPSSLLHLEIDKHEAPAVAAPAAAPTFLASPPPAASAAPPAALAALASPPTEDDNVNSKTCSTQPPPMTFRLQKAAPAKKQKSKPALGGKGGGRLAKLSVAAPTGLISPPTVSTPVRRMPPMPMQLKQSNGGLSRPPPLALGNAANSAMAAAAASPLALGSDSSMSPLSPSMPQTPGASNSGSGMQFAGILGDCSAFGEVSPSFHAQRTPSPAAWAPTFLITPPSPPLPGTRIDSTSGQASDAASASASASLAPCTPPWPKSGSSLRKTIFDHIGQPQLSPMDLRGYMAISMNS